MTETGNVLNDLVEDVMEVKAVEKKEVPEFAKFLKEEQVAALVKAGYVDKLSVRAASDEQLVKVEGIGAATVMKLREWGISEVEKGNAIARRFLVLKCGDETLDVRPGDIIPAKFGAKEVVEKGKASWE